jgi:hypothetical protein
MFSFDGLLNQLKVCSSLHFLGTMIRATIDNIDGTLFSIYVHSFIHTRTLATCLFKRNLANQQKVSSSLQLLGGPEKGNKWSIGCYSLLEVHLCPQLNVFSSQMLQFIIWYQFWTHCITCSRDHDYLSCLLAARCSVMLKRHHCQCIGFSYCGLSDISCSTKILMLHVEYIIWSKERLWFKCCSMWTIWN